MHTINNLPKISISHLGNAHSDWLRALDFYKLETVILKERLTEIAGKNTGAEVMKEVEHFENQFKIQGDNIDRLRHEIHVNLASISREAQRSSAGYIDGILLVQHNNLKERYEAEEKIFNELRRDFNKFASAMM